MIVTIAFQINFKESKYCAFLCEKSYEKNDVKDAENIRQLQKGMKLNYQHHWFVYKNSCKILNTS